MGVLTLHSRIELELFVRYILLSFTGAPISLGLDMHTFKIHLVHIMVSKKKTKPQSLLLSQLLLCKVQSMAHSGVCTSGAGSVAHQ